ncbi:MAG: iron-sulfur cluster repair di-iron protein [Balneolales bacterium]
MWTRFYLPALFYFIVVAATGSLLRFLWTAPAYTLFNAQYLIHAHSHVALLGWIFLVLCGLLLEYGMQKNQPGKKLLSAFSILVQITVIGMLISFTLQGYAPASIAFSTIHILLSYYFAWLYFRHERMDIDPRVRNFYNAAVLWMILSSLGPLLLAAGSRLTLFWMNTAIGFYLHLQFNGWFTFLLTGLAFQFLINRHYWENPTWGNWPFVLMFVGLLPSLVPIIDNSGLARWMIGAGAAGTLAFSAGSLMVLHLVWKSRVALAGKGAAGLFWFAFTAGAVKTLMQAATAWPQVHIFSSSHYVVIGFNHLLLLGFISSSLLYILLCKQPAPDPMRIRLTGSLLYQTGAGAMLVLLFGIGFMQILGVVISLPFQLWLFITGVLILTGLLFLTAALASRSMNKPILTQNPRSMKTSFNKPIAQLVNENYRTASVFENYQLDFCCGGQRTLAEACQSKNVDTLAVLEDLEAVGNGDSFFQQRVEKWSTPFLIDYIVYNHHEYIRENGPRVEASIKKVAGLHSETQPENSHIARLFSDLLTELESHMSKEENDFFPTLNALSKALETNETLSPSILEKINHELEHEHKNAGSIMNKIRTLSQDYTPPAGACTTYIQAYSELLAFERDLHRHVHLENNVLFPRFS